jgi:urocanate hydratase
MCVYTYIYVNIYIKKYIHTHITCICICICIYTYVGEGAFARKAGGTLSEKQQRKFKWTEAVQEEGDIILAAGLGGMGSSQPLFLSQGVPNQSINHTHTQNDRQRERRQKKKAKK